MHTLRLVQVMKSHKKCDNVKKVHDGAQPFVVNILQTSVYKSEL
jgi:hypothetical protein